MKIKDLKTGNVIETKTGHQYLCAALLALDDIPSVCVRFDGGIIESVNKFFFKYDPNINDKPNPDYQIVKVFECIDSSAVIWMFNVCEDRSLNLSESEINLLKGFNSIDEYNFIGRDEDGDLYLTKYRDEDESYIAALNHLFMFIRDGEQYKISDLVGGE